MTDPTAFRDEFRTAASVRAVMIADAGCVSTWSADVVDAKGKNLGTAIAAFAGPFDAAGVNAIGVKLLDLGVVAPAWTLGVDGSYRAEAHSQRA